MFQNMKKRKKKQICKHHLKPNLFHSTLQNAPILHGVARDKTICDIATLCQFRSRFQNKQPPKCCPQLTARCSRPCHQTPISHSPGIFSIGVATTYCALAMFFKIKKRKK